VCTVVEGEWGRIRESSAERGKGGSLVIRLEKRGDRRVGKNFAVGGTIGGGAGRTGIKKKDVKTQKLLALLKWERR